MSTKSKPEFPRIAQLKSSDQFLEKVKELNIDLPFSANIDPSVFEDAVNIQGMSRAPGNRFCILPMEGWDGTEDGKPTEFTKRRWRNFAISGAKLLFGCEAVAVCHDGRANPNQLMINEENLTDFTELYEMLMVEHDLAFGDTSDFLVGLQLTHSGRFCKPNSKTKMEPQILYHHPVLDGKFGLDIDYELMSDDYIDKLILKYIDAAVLAQRAGFHFVDIKHCHGYLGHEFLSAHDRPGKYGGSFENRSRFFREIVEGIQNVAPDLGIAIRLSAFDFQPFKQGENSKGIPSTDHDYPYAFGGGKDGLSIDLEETIKFLSLAKDLGVNLVCVTGGSPYYNPHIIRPALFPPSDGYLPPEDPLIGVDRQIQVTAQLKKALPEMTFVGSAYTYLQEWLPQVATAVLQKDMADFIGLGRMVLSYPDLPADIMNGKDLQRKKICRTFSDCTTAPRNGIISGCYPLDDFYKSSSYYDQLQTIKGS